MAEYRKDSGNTGSDIERGAKKAVRAGKTAVRAGKAIGKAAAGDYAGAAKEVLQSEGLRKLVIIIICLSILLTLLVFFAAPLAIYEGIKGYAETIRNRWLEDYYAFNGNRAIAALKATLTGAWDIITDVWDATSGLTYNDNGQADSDAMSSDDITVLGLSDSLVNVYSKKIEACINKMNARAKMVEDAIHASANGSTGNTGTINGWVCNYLFWGRDYNVYADLEDTRNVYYGGVNATTASQSLTKREAVRIIAIYSAMYNADFSKVEPYALMKWLGYYTGNANPVYFTVGDAVTCSVKGWTGEFMPMYLVHESRDNELDYSAYQCAAADVLLTVSSDPLASLIPVVEKTEYRHTEYETYAGTTSAWRLLSYEDYITYYTPAYPMTAKPICRSASERWAYYRGSLSYNDMIRAYNHGALGWYCVEEYMSYTVPVEVVEYDYTLTYNFNASVGMRSAKSIYKLAGFYDDEE